ncbi:ABC transporter permease [Micromonospora sp. WMMD1102]|uniref:ABC transporter permease n=1 Tax=Micromonospora sp. WMMD1102 TaxID=3016105 RepID=UPI0024155952|nr:ABC transporter permease [Micromonospora sp. WMMD1102]MDG4785095.1 ABC transporter permease [Micromonospora sp. WMMD1102]
MISDALHSTAVQIRHNVLLRLRDPAQIVSYVFLPMALMLVFEPLYRRALDGGTLQTVTGPLILFSVFALGVVGNAVLTEREWRTWDRLRASRASRTSLLLGKAVPVFAVLLVQQTVLLVFGCAVVGLPVPRNLLLVALAVLLWGFAVLAAGTALATVVRSRGDLMLATDLGAILVGSLGGALVPVDLMPGWLRNVAPASPGYWGLALMQDAVQGDLGGMLVPALVVAGMGLALAVFATYRLSRGWGRSHLL